MKSVIFVRHSKSSWENPRLDDFDRPLNKRGLTDSVAMANRLTTYKIQPDYLLSSPSVRTTMTMEAFKSAFGLGDECVSFDQHLYHAPVSYLEEVLYGLPELSNLCMVFTHNPGITSLANKFSNYPIDNVPTTGLFKIDFQCEKWEDVSVSNFNMDFFIYPKMYS